MTHLNLLPLQRNKSHWPLLLAGAALLALASAPVTAETPEQKGLAIATEIDKRDIGFGDSQAQLTMTLTNSHGQSSIRKLRLSTLENTDTAAGDKSLTVFDHPRDVKGTAFLSFTKILEPDDQWLFLPALKRVKRISSANKSGPFVGSEFAYEDLVSFEVGKYTYKWIRDEACGTLTCFVVARYPLYENSGYTRQITWVDQAEYRVQKVEYYDRKESLLKTLNQTAYQQYLNQYWRPLKMHMVNHQTGKETTLEFSPYTFQVGLNDSAFTPNRLKKVR
ncbi:MAG: outer membrane lipoprotein-sorting protein [Rhodospirillales bacterium]|nr:outer membrane lipoprotein-sorting protein [Rhodospirillales bacterium]